MNIRFVTPEFAVSPQIIKDDAAELAKAGFTKVINNRPDGESADQPTSMNIMSAVSSEGMGYLHIPIVGSTITDRDIEEFSNALTAANGPILGFCRTGTRSTKLWALSQVGKRSIEDILAHAKSAGYDLSDFRSVLEQRKKTLPEGTSHENP